MVVDRERFEQIVQEVFENLPAKFQKYIHNLAVLVEESSSAEERRLAGGPARGTLLGLYHGVPFTHRSSYYGNMPPDVIVLYQRPIESLSRDEEELRQRVKDVLLHEIAHYFGFSESELKDIEDT